MNNSNRKYNISTKFLLPILKFSKKVLEEYLPEFGFVNTYINCNVLTYPFEVLYILFNPKELDLNFFNFEKEFCKNTNYIETYDLGNNLVLFIFRIPKEYQRDFNLFIEGKYSKTSKSYQNLFPKESYITDSTGRKMRDNKGFYLKEPSSFFHIFNKTDFLKRKWREKLGYDDDDPIFEDIELYDTQDIMKETLISKITL